MRLICPSTICKEMIKLMDQIVLSVIVDEIKPAKYFLISVDATPDIMHVDQLTVIILYVFQYGPVRTILKVHTDIFSHWIKNCSNHSSVPGRKWHKH